VKFVLDNIWMVLAAVVSGTFLVWPFISRRLSGTSEVGPMEAVQLINRKDALVLDLREPGEFGAGHAPHARNIPAGQLENRIGELDKFKGRPLILACQTGGRSHSVTGLLKKAGFAEVFVLSGGVNAWQQASLPLEK
jgi:rhodanese-related sulfurtransferase